jgi:general secretion pathway protein G
VEALDVRGARRCPPPHVAARSGGGWTLIELLLILALIGVIASILVPLFLQAIERAKVRRAIADMRLLDFEIGQYEDREDRLPESLDELPRGSRLDPWGRSFVYFKFGEPGWRGRARKDRFLVPINTFYDLYSVGPDGESRPPLQNPRSHDDIVRANDGQFYGLGRDF